MLPQEFMAKWQRANLTERSAAQKGRIRLQVNSLLGVRYETTTEAPQTVLAEDATQTTFDHQGHSELGRRPSATLWQMADHLVWTGY
ncbi:MAG: hypothetical protein ACJ8FY_22020 [Gemmataceae bacterium]